MHMCVNHNTGGNPERLAEDNVGRLPANPWKVDQVFHSGWDFTIVAFYEGLAATDDILGFHSEKSGGMDFPFELFLVGIDEIAWPRIFLEE
jgi:hypothetical protein